MVTTRSKSVRLNANPDVDESIDQLTTLAPQRNIKQKGRVADGSARYTIIFILTLLDLLAFTTILPLFPHILTYYKTYDGPNGLYSYLEAKVDRFRILVGAPLSQNSVLFGGFLGSLFSFLQFIASPIIGGLSDVYGRKALITFCLVGMAFSYFLWSISATFAMFIIARIIGGISKGNLSLSMAAITDVSTTEKRASGMALIGAAFSVAFVIGPLFGAYFSKQFVSQTGEMWFTKPAMFSFSLVAADIFFVLAMFKETLPKEKRMKSVVNSLHQAYAYINIKDIFQFSAMKNIAVKDLRQLRTLGWVYFIYLFLYSGLEFTLTFLVHYKFEYTKIQQGWMYSGIGITMAVFQGGIVRRISPEAVQNYASWALLLTVPSFLFIGLAQSTLVLNFGIFLFAVSTSFVVPCMTTMVSKYGSASQKGTALGIFRSLGALGRALGPVIASTAYWIYGPAITFTLGGVLLFIPWCILQFSTVMKT